MTGEWRDFGGPVGANLHPVYVEITCPCGREGLVASYAVWPCPTCGRQYKVEPSVRVYTREERAWARQQRAGGE